MNYEETTNLLTICASFDARTIGSADVMAWQSVLSDLAFVDAEQAVKAHYGRETERIKPAHIRAGVKQIRRERIDTADASFVFNGDPDDIGEYRRQLRAHRRAVGDGQSADERPQLEQRYSSPDQVMSQVFKSPTKTLIPGQRVAPSPRTQALLRAQLERGSKADVLEGEILPAVRAS